MKFELVKQAYAEKTLEKMEYPVKLYLQFCEQYKLQIFPRDNILLLKQLERYLIYRLKFAKGTSSTVKSDIDALQRWFATFGIDVHARSYKPIQAIFKVADRLYPSKNQTTRPLELWEVQLILRGLDVYDYNQLVLYTVWVFAFTTGLRAHEYLAKSNSKNISQKKKLLYLRRDRIFIKENNGKHWGIAWYWYSKNNQNFKRQLVTLPCFCNLGCCAVKALQLLLNRMPNKSKNAAIFTWANGKFVTSSDTNYALKNACKSIGVDHVHVANHSWRKTCVTQAIKQGMPDSLVVQLMDWKSFTSCRPYINLNPRDLIAQREKFAQQYNDMFASAFNDQRFRIFSHVNKFLKY